MILAHINPPTPELGSISLLSPVGGAASTLDFPSQLRHSTSAGGGALATLPARSAVHYSELQYSALQYSAWAVVHCSNQAVHYSAVHWAVVYCSNPAVHYCTVYWLSLIHI